MPPTVKLPRKARAVVFDMDGLIFNTEALYRDAVIGWANVKRQHESLDLDLGFVGKRPRDRTFGRELEAELARFAAFLTPAQSHGD